MAEHEAVSIAERTDPPPTSYVRFIVIGAARTGTNMLVHALNSNPRVRCFGEVFNPGVDFISYDVDGYDNFNRRDLDLRASDFNAFLAERIFTPMPDGIRAVGFKLLYGQYWSFPGLVDRLASDVALHVVHLRRRNLLRTVVSWKIAEATGVWLERRRTPLTPSNALTAVRHPMRALAALRRRVRPKRPPATGPWLRLTPEECREMFEYLQAHERRVDEVYREHPKLTVFYEDLERRPDDVFTQVQTFLELDPRPLEVTSRRQNPQPLRELLANYDELRAAFAGTAYARFFDDDPRR